MVLRRFLIACIAVGGASDRAATLDTEIVSINRVVGLALQCLPIACFFAVGGASEHAAALDTESVPGVRAVRMVLQRLLVALSCCKRGQ